jgi:hypothetical protein
MMFSAIRKRMHLTPSTVIATLALVFAMTGGAYAAKHYLITSTKQISPKVLKALKGANGKAGAAGANGVNGAQGAQGTAGANGKDGANGSNGKDGVSVTAGAASGVECPSGGVKYTSASGANAVCNGTTGFTETLPSEKTEMGTWGGVTLGSSGYLVTTISFPIPLKEALSSTRVHFVTVEDVKTSKIPTGCGGSLEEPKAEPGNLCVFEGGPGEAFSGGVGIDLPGPGGGSEPEQPGAGTTGALLIGLTESGHPIVHGTFAVTAAE